jgi:hypothetical protein
VPNNNGGSNYEAPYCCHRYCCRLCYRNVVIEEVSSSSGESESAFAVAVFQCPAYYYLLLSVHRLTNSNSHLYLTLPLLLSFRHSLDLYHITYIPYSSNRYCYHLRPNLLRPLKPKQQRLLEKPPKATTTSMAMAPCPCLCHIQLLHQLLPLCPNQQLHQ